MRYEIKDEAGNVLTDDGFDLKVRAAIANLEATKPKPRFWIADPDPEC